MVRKPIKLDSQLSLKYMPLGLRSDNGKKIYWKLVRYYLQVDRAKRYCLRTEPKSKVLFASR